MNHSSFSAVFPRQLRRWTFHCLLNSLPSLIIATAWMGLWREPAAMAAMFSAIGTFIVLYAVLTSFDGPLADENHVLSRALRLGSKIRAWISGLSILMVFPPVIFLMPDFWCGLLASNIVENAGRRFSLQFPHGGFLKIFATTMLEGFILSFMLAMISFFAVIYLQGRERRKFLASTNPGIPVGGNL